MSTTKKLLLTLVLITIGSLAVGGYLLVTLHRTAVQNAEVTLTMVSDQKRQQVERLLDDMREDLTLFSVGVAPMAKMITDWVEGGQQDEVLQTRFSSRLQEIAKAHHHASITVFDLAGNPLVIIGPPPSTQALRAVGTAVEHRSLQFVDLHQKTGQGFEFGMMMPVMPQGRPPIAALYFSKIAEDQLYPALGSWPIPTDTGETYLTIQQDREIVLVSPLRNRAIGPLALRLPLADTELPSAQAIGGKTGFMRDGVDYREKPVLTVATPIKDSPWYMMTKVDSEEVLVDFNRLAILTVGATLVTLGLIYLAAYLVWRLDGERRSLAVTTRSLATTEERLRFALDATSDGVWDWHTRSGEAFCNPAFFTMLGYPPADYIPDMRARFLQLLHPDDRERALTASQQGLAGSDYFEMEFRLLAKEGHYRWILSRGQVVERDESGRPLRVVGTHVDMTERKEAEQAVHELNATLEARVLERTAQLASANAAKSEFLAMMSHEIRTPMNAVLGLTQLLQQEPLEPGQLATVRHIREAGDTLLHIINDVLDFSKIEAGQLKLDLQPFQLASVMERVDRLLRPSAIGKGLKLRFAPVPAGVGCVISDAHRLEQVLINLIGNAVKFTQEGEITVNLFLLEHEPNGRVRLRFEITDTGMGVAPEALSHLFRAFSQADSGITRRFGGTGLGLAISKRIVELLGGRIGVDSELGKGSTFWFELPFEPSVQTEDSGASAFRENDDIRSRLAGLRVLAVDDSRMNLLVLQRALQSWGVDVMLANDGQQALRALEARPDAFDMVLMDVQMPVMDGLTATREIRKDPRLAALPVIALTAGVLPEEQQAALDAGFNDVLNKPLDLQQVQARLLQYR